MQDYQLIIKVQKLLGKKCKFEFQVMQRDPRGNLFSLLYQ